ncbi:ABC transporter [Rhizocola hellebori]|uniref:ABC transporter n=1 Tax=Rhizocola hellebori TaxID=1392758 RepID=A0A8J3QCI1_9ACTN|nr:ABC transporter ATP-binding protein [Rhizocola hellebori]GIH06936.1 ABC transporter [Rhizocola hellebori]
MPPRLPHADPGTPDIRSPLRYAWWLARCQPWRVFRGSVIGTAWMVGLSVRPYLIARAVDGGLRTGDYGALLWWVAAIVVAGIALAWLGIMRHRTMTFVREDATARSAAVVLRAVSRGGAALTRKLDAGEVATVSGSDIGNVSHVLTLTGPGVGAVIAYGVVAIVLWSVSPFLAMFVLLGVPAIAVAIGPLLRRLDRAESVYRREQGALTAQASDIVAGLRVLAGVGGRSLFARSYAGRSQRLLLEGYRVGAVASWIFAGIVVIPGLFLAAVVWLAARMAGAGEITIGQMVAVYGYVAILILPVYFLLEGGYQLIRGRVAARRIIALLKLAPDGTAEAVTAKTPSAPADLHDPATGLRVRPGELLAVAAADPAEAIALADRLGRFAPGEVTWGGEPLAGMPLAQVRERILVDEHDSYLFAGTLREVLQIRPELGDAQITAALHAASAEDVVEALPLGLDTPVGVRARNLSGGQRQRVRLARALLAEPEVLILIDPTSAVDAHTEARIALRLRSARQGRATVVIATSPLMLGRADRVAHLRDGRIVSTATHAELMETDRAYRALVSRDVDSNDDLDSDSDTGFEAVRR